MRKTIRKTFKYIEPLWLGNDNKISLRSVAAMALIIDFIINVHNSASIVVKVLNLIYYDKQIDATLIAAMSGNLAQIAMILGIEAALIAAMLALKTYQGNVQASLGNINNQNSSLPMGGYITPNNYVDMNPTIPQQTNSQEGIIE